MRPQVVSLRVGPRAGVVRIRPGTADQSVFDEVFHVREFDLPIDRPEFIVDAGAHIGIVSLFFAQKYPDALIVAIEPDQKNFALLKENVRRFPNVQVLNAALWGSPGRVNVVNPSAMNWSYRVKLCDADSGVECVTVPQLMSRFGVTQLDLLKMDIEGAEVEVLDSGDDWLPCVGALVIELHDRFRPECSAVLHRAIAGLGFVESVAGEKRVFRKPR